jgi:hypothetical protein
MYYKLIHLHYVRKLNPTSSKSWGEKKLVWTEFQSIQ